MSIIDASSFLIAKKWEQLHGEKFESWRKNRWVDTSETTRKFLEHLFPLGQIEGEKRLLPHQSEALQRIIYSFEELKMMPLMTTLATGTGKTVVMASVMAWLACQEEAVDTFVLFCPNTIVRDRLRRDFEKLSVFKEFNLFPREYSDRLKSLSCSIIEGYQNCTNLLGKDILVANRHQFQKGYSGGNDHLAFLKRDGGKLAIFNDEAHNTRGTEYSRTLKVLAPQTKFRLDITATPDRADNLRPQCHEIYHLPVIEAITGSYQSNSHIDSSFKEYPPLVKDVVVQRPRPDKVHAIQFQDLKFQDAKTGRTFSVREINWEDWPNKKNLQLVMDPGGMKMQLGLANEAFERKKRLAKGRYKPLLFVIAPSIIGAKKAVEMMKETFNLKPLLVVGDIDDKMDIKDKKSLREAAANLGNPESPYDSVVSVYMLREGWDVPEVSVMCLLRGFGSPLFAHQVLGRGLRLIRRNNLEKDRSVQELTVIDHPCLQLDGLWVEIDALVREGEEIIRPLEIPRDGTGGVSSEEGDPPQEQQLIRPELKQLLKVPSPSKVEEITSERILGILESCLKIIKEYKIEDVVIVGGTSLGLDNLRPKRNVETIDKTIKVSVLPNDPQKDREPYLKKFTEMLMSWAEDYCDRYSPLTVCNDEVYRVLLCGFEDHLFQKREIISIHVHELYGAQNIIPQIKEAVTYEMNRRIYTEEMLKSG